MVAIEEAEMMYELLKTEAREVFFIFCLLFVAIMSPEITVSYYAFMKNFHHIIFTHYTQNASVIH